jgi:hypothetical protein
LVVKTFFEGGVVNGSEDECTASDSYTFRSENLSLTFIKTPVETPLPAVGGDEGEGGPNLE